MTAGARSISKANSSSELSVQTRSIRLDETAMASSPLGAFGGPDGVRVGVGVGATGVEVLVGVEVSVGVGVRVEVGVEVGGTGVVVGVAVGV